MSGVGMGGMMLWMVVWGLVGVAILVLVVLGIVWAVGRDRETRGRLGADSAEEILKRRYAAGEIDEDEFLRRQSGLTQ